MQQNSCGSNAASLLFTVQQDFGECADDGSLSPGVSSGTGGGAGAASQQTVTAIGGMQQNPCGSTVASLLFVTQQDFGECADGAAAAAGGFDTDTASQQTFTAIGAMQQNPCGSNIASLLFTTQQDFGECAGATSVNGATGDGVDTASQQTFTAIGAMQQNPCGSNIASLFFTTQQDYGECAEAAAVDGKFVRGPVGGNTASQQTFTAIGAMQQNPCGSTTASLFFVTQQDYGTCSAEDVASGDIASQQTSTALGGLQQNACGSSAWSLFFSVQQDFGACGDVIDAVDPADAVSGVLQLGEPTVGGESAGAFPGPELPVGDEAVLSVPVANTGTTEVSGLTGDSPAGELDCADAFLTAGEVTTCSVPVTAVAGPQQVPLTVGALSPSGDVLVGEGTAYYVGTVSGPGLVMGVPLVNGEAADAAPGPSVTPGESTTLTAPVMNIGSVPLGDLSGSSPVGSLSCADNSLDPGGVTTCSVPTTSVAGAQAVPLTVSGTAPSGESADTAGTAHYTGESSRVAADEEPGGPGGGDADAGDADAGDADAGDADAGDADGEDADGAADSDGDADGEDGDQVTAVPSGGVDAGFGPTGTQIGLLLGLFAGLVVPTALAIRFRTTRSG